MSEMLLVFWHHIHAEIGCTYIFECHKTDFFIIDESRIMIFLRYFLPNVNITHNSALCFQWLIGIPKATTFMGCIGNDKYGKILEKKTTEAGVAVSYQIDEATPTGTCAVLLTGKQRCVVAPTDSIDGISQY